MPSFQLDHEGLSRFDAAVFIYLAGSILIACRKHYFRVAIMSDFLEKIKKKLGL